MCITFCKNCGSRISGDVTDNFCSVECFNQFEDGLPALLDELNSLEEFAGCLNCLNPECDGNTCEIINDFMAHFDGYSEVM